MRRGRRCAGLLLGVSHHKAVGSSELTQIEAEVKGADDRSQAEDAGWCAAQEASHRVQPARGEHSVRVEHEHDTRRPLCLG